MLYLLFISVYLGLLNDSKSLSNYVQEQNQNENYATIIFRISSKKLIQTPQRTTLTMPAMCPAFISFIEIKQDI